jgi:hypothetical protein
MTAALVTPIHNPHPPGNRLWTIVDFTFSTSYPAGGEPMTASLFNLNTVDAVVPLGSPLAAAAVIPVYDSANNTLALYTASTGAKVGTASDQSANKIRLLILGI